MKLRKMKWLVVIFFSVFSFASFGQEVVELGVKFTLKDSVLNITLLDGKYKQIKINESKHDSIVEIELIRNYYFEGDTVYDHKLYTKDGFIKIEIISGDKKKKFIFQRSKKIK